MKENRETIYESSIQKLIQQVRDVGGYLQEHADEIVYRGPYLEDGALKIIARFNYGKVPILEIGYNVVVLKHK
ncbi:MAG: hypothetical protein ACOX4I_07840 [Anaerovoracaceae bacterium]|jgi:hypothetical protein